MEKGAAASAAMMPRYSQALASAADRDRDLSRSRLDWMETPCRSRHSRTCTDGCSGSASRCKVLSQSAHEWLAVAVLQMKP